MSKKNLLKLLQVALCFSLITVFAVIPVEASGTIKQWTAKGTYYVTDSNGMAWYPTIDVILSVRHISDDGSTFTASIDTFVQVHKIFWDNLGGSLGVTYIKNNGTSLALHYGDVLYDRQTYVGLDMTTNTLTLLRNNSRTTSTYAYYAPDPSRTMTWSSGDVSMSESWSY